MGVNRVVVVGYCYQFRRTGFLAESADELAECIIEAFNMSAKERDAMVLLLKESASD